MLHAATEFAKKAGRTAVALTAMTAVALPLVFGGAAQAEPGDGVTVADVANMPRNEALAYIVRSSAPYALKIGQDGGQGVFKCLNEAFVGKEVEERNAQGQLVVPKGTELTHTFLLRLNSGGLGREFADAKIEAAVTGYAQKGCNAKLALNN